MDGRGVQGVVPMKGLKNPTSSIQKDATPYWLRGLATRVRTLRFERRWSQEYCAARAGLDASAWSRIERAERDVRFSTVIKVSQAFNMTVIELLEGVAE